MHRNCSHLWTCSAGKEGLKVPSYAMVNVVPVAVCETKASENVLQQGLGSLSRHWQATRPCQKCLRELYSEKGRRFGSWGRRELPSQINLIGFYAQTNFFMTVSDQETMKRYVARGTTECYSRGTFETMQPKVSQSEASSLLGVR